MERNIPNIIRGKKKRTKKMILYDFIILEFSPDTPNSQEINIIYTNKKYANHILRLVLCSTYSSLFVFIYSSLYAMYFSENKPEPNNTIIFVLKFKSNL